MSVTSRPDWGSLESLVRGEAQRLIEAILEEEVEDFLGRKKSERRAPWGDGYRKGYGKPRKLSLSNGKIEIRRPRVRGVEERFESRVLPLFKRQTKEVQELRPELYLN